MKQFILKNKKALTGTLAMILVAAGTMSFQDFPFNSGKLSAPEAYYHSGCYADTMPEKNGMKMKDFEKLQSDLNKTLSTVGDELKKMDFSKMQKDLEVSLKDVDIEKIRADVSKALKQIDMDQLMADTRSSLQNIDLGYKQADIEKAFAEAKKEIEKARIELKEVEKDAINKELEKVKIEISKIDLDKIMAGAREGVDKAKLELKQLQAMFNEMEKDGLISSKNGFTIEYKNKDLYIDGTRQPEKTTDKYRKYFKQEKFKITIEKH